MTISLDEARDILFPDLPVIDSHHHLLDRAFPELARVIGRDRFLIDDYAAEVASGHNVVASVAVEARVMYRADGPADLRPVGETEFFNGQAAMAASGLYGPCRVAAGIVGHVDLRAGARAREVLEAHLAAAPGRFRGIRQEAMWDADPDVISRLCDNPAGLYDDPRFRKGFAELAPLGLSFDAFVLSSQLPDVLRLASDHPDTQIILNHAGSPVGVGVHHGKLSEEYPQWRRDMAAIAACPNVAVKIGGLGSFLLGSSFYRASPPPGVEELVVEWRPYIEPAIELFGAERCMFESNMPTDGSGDFRTVCNAFKAMTADCSDDERRAIFAGTAARVYRLDLDGALA